MKHLMMILMLLSSLHVLAQQPPQPTIPTAKSANTRKIETLLKKMSYQLEKADSNTWAIPFKGNHLPQLQVVITESEGLTIFFCIVKGKASTTISAEKRLLLLTYNMDFDRAKIGIDDEDNLMVRIDISTRIADQTELETNIEQLAAAADEVYGLMFGDAGTPKGK